MISMVGRYISFSFMVLERQFIEVHWGRRRWTLYHSERFCVNGLRGSLQTDFILEWKHKKLLWWLRWHVNMLSFEISSCKYLYISLDPMCQTQAGPYLLVLWPLETMRPVKQSDGHKATKQQRCKQKNRKKWIIIKLCVISTQPAIHHLLSFKNEIFHRTPT